MQLFVVLAVLVSAAVCLAAPAEQQDAPADLSSDDLQGAELFFRKRYYRPRYHGHGSGGYGYGHGYGYGYGHGYGGHGFGGHSYYRPRYYSTGY